MKMEVDHNINPEAVLGRLRRCGVDISSFNDVVIALESEVRHYRSVLDHMQAQLNERESGRSHGADLFEAGRLFGLTSLRQRIMGLSKRCIRRGQLSAVSLCNAFVRIIDKEISNGE